MIDMSEGNDLNAVCSVSEMADKLALSRARFYQLLELGVFPLPVYCIWTKRPFYPMDLQQKCADIRRTGIGLSGKPVIFNRPRKDNQSRNGVLRKYEGLTLTLKNMGLDVTVNKVKDAVGLLYQGKSLKNTNTDLLVRDLFRHFTRDCKNDV
ncbi:MAG: hypothetical protein MUP16_01415 [Sedimentisphaerales bacterium]|nr:hypothetical protein [Sedimentisphaerales bacterium]